MVISHTLLAAWDAIISPTEIESIRQILHALHKTIMRRIILMSKHKLLPIYNQFYCHVNMAGLKPTWHLEPLRPDYGYGYTLSMGCNPE